MTNEPNHNSIEIMRAIDAMPDGWRALVYEYGFVAVADLYGDMDLEDADDALWLQRSAKQAQWLATDFISKRSFAQYV